MGCTAEGPSPTTPRRRLCSGNSVTCTTCTNRLHCCPPEAYFLVEPVEGCHCRKCCRQIEPHDSACICMARTTRYRHLLLSHLRCRSTVYHIHVPCSRQENTQTQILLALFWRSYVCSHASKSLRAEGPPAQAAQAPSWRALDIHLGAQGAAMPMQNVNFQWAAPYSRLGKIASTGQARLYSRFCYPLNACTNPKIQGDILHWASSSLPST